jgi:hypothetical protein
MMKHGMCVQPHGSLMPKLGIEGTSKHLWIMPICKDLLPSFFYIHNVVSIVTYFSMFSISYILFAIFKSNENIHVTQKFVHTIFKINMISMKNLKEFVK